jgi:hypothetical protein
MKIPHLPIKNRTKFSKEKSESVVVTSSKNSIYIFSKIDALIICEKAA